MQTEKQKMLAGELYNPDCHEIAADSKRAAEWMNRYIASNTLTQPQREELLRELFGKVGNGVNIRPPFHCDFGYNISLGDGVFLNFNWIILDVLSVEIGDKTQIGPGVQILTPDHPRDPDQRRAGLEFGRPITIGRNVWIGGGAIILPGWLWVTTRLSARVPLSRETSRQV